VTSKANHPIRLTEGRKRELRKRFGGVPFLKLLKMRVDALGNGTVTLSMPIREEIRQYLGVTHGGALSTLADTAATFAALTMLPLGTEVTTVEFKVNFLEPVEQKRAIAKARIIRLGGRTAIGEATITESGKSKPAAVGLFTMYIFRRDLTPSGAAS